MVTPTPTHSGSSIQNYDSNVVLLLRYRALTSLTARSANMAINSFMTHQLFGRLSNWPDSSRSRNTKLQKIPIPFFEKVELRTRHPIPDMRVINNWEAMAFEAVR